MIPVFFVNVFKYKITHFLQTVVSRQIAPTNEAVDEDNKLMINKFPGAKIVYKSCESVEETAHR